MSIDLLLLTVLGFVVWMALDRNARRWPLELFCRVLRVLKVFWCSVVEVRAEIEVMRSKFREKFPDLDNSDGGMLR